MAAGSDTLYREFVQRCENSGGETTIKATVTAVSGTENTAGITGITVTSPDVGEVLIIGQGSNVGDTCTIPIAGSYTGTATAAGTASLTANLKTENGTSIGVTRSETVASGATGAIASADTEVTGYTQVSPHAALVEFGSINKLVLSLLPLVIVVGFMGTSFVSLYRNRNSGGGGIANAIKVEVGTLIVALIAIFVSPIALDFIGSASQVVTGETLNNTLTFGDIMELLFGFMPVGITLGIIALIGWRGYQSYKDMRGGSSGGGML